MKFNRQQFVVSRSSLGGSTFQMVSRIFCLNFFVFRVSYFYFLPVFHALQYHGPVEVRIFSKLRKRNGQLHDLLQMYLLRIFIIYEINYLFEIGRYGNFEVFLADVCQSTSIRSSYEKHLTENLI